MSENGRRLEEEEPIYVLPEGADATADFQELTEEAQGVSTLARREFRWRAPWWIDLILLVGAVAAVNIVVAPRDLGFRSRPLNPYFLPILFLALRHGPLAGLWAGLISCALYIVPGRTTGLEGPFLLVPGLFVVAGVCIGELSRRSRARAKYYKSCTEKLCLERVSLRRSLAERDEAVRELQHRIEDQSVSVGSILRLAPQMNSLEPDGIDRAILDLTAAVLSARHVALYDVRGAELTVRASRVPPEWPPSQPPNPGEGLPGLSLRLRRVVSILDLPPESVLIRVGTPAVLCGPLGPPEAPFALAVVHEMPLEEFSPESVTRFAAILEWASGAYERAALYRGMRRRAERNGNGVPPPSSARAARTLLTARIADFANLNEEARVAARRKAAHAIHRCTGGAEVIPSAWREDTFAVVLPPEWDHGTNALAQCIRAHAGFDLDFGFACFDRGETFLTCLEGLIGNASEGVRA